MIVNDRRVRMQYRRLALLVAVVTFLRLPASFAQATVFGSFEYERFSRDVDPWKLATFELSGKSERGTLIGRVEEARRFSQSGTLFEVDAYPQFSKSTYAYLNLGGSSSSILPHRRYGAELFHGFTNSWEVSGGARRVDFGGPSTIYTGSIGKYQGNYWAAVRPWVVDRGGERLNAVSFVMRRYFATADDYVGLEAQAGQTPADPAVARELGLARWSGGVQAQHLVGSILLRGRIAVESINAGSGMTRRGTIASAGIGRRF